MKITAENNRIPSLKQKATNILHNLKIKTYNEKNKDIS